MCGICAAREIRISDPSCLERVTYGLYDTGAGITTPSSLAGIIVTYAGDDDGIGPDASSTAESQASADFMGTPAANVDVTWAVVDQPNAANLDDQSASQPRSTVERTSVGLPDISIHGLGDEDDDSVPDPRPVSTYTETTSGAYHLNSVSIDPDGNIDPDSNGANGIELQIREIADYLRVGFWQDIGLNQRSFDVGSDNSITVNLANLDATYRAHALLALQTWTDITGIQFVEVYGQAEIKFTDIGSRKAYSNSAVLGSTIVSSDINVSTDWDDRNGDQYTFQTFIHEIGHALGLGHTGNYNGRANYATDAAFALDSWQTSVMSYFSQTENTHISASFNFLLTPMLADILAIQDIYGSSTTARFGDTVYGYNSNAGEIYEFDNWLANFGRATFALTIVDSGGIDTIDLSGSHHNNLINLNAGTFSDVMGSQGNLAIAYGSVIENAIGGSGNDKIIGNEADNTLIGGAGRDQLSGGGGDDTIYFDANDDLAQVQGGEGTDTLFILYDVAPTSFDLAAHGFERAERVIETEAGNDEYFSYDASWNLLTHRVFSFNGAQTLSTFDVNDNELWTRTVETLNRYNQLLVQEFYWDNGAHTVNEFDPYNEHDWHTNRYTYDRPGGTLIGHEQVLDNGVIVDLLAGNDDAFADDSSTTARLEVGSSLTGTLETGDDIDWISVDLVAGQEYIINLEGYGPSNVPDTYLRVWAPGSADANTGSLVGRNDDGGPGLYSQLTFTAQETGTYYLDVRSYAGWYEGDYQISVDVNSDESTANVDTITADSATIAHLTLESDIFDSEASASFTSALETGDDIDWISVDLVAGQEYIINLEGYGPSNVPDTYLRVWAPGSVDPENGELVGRNDDGGPGLYSQLTFTAQETGRYYLDVRSYAGLYEGDYQISVDVNSDESTANVDTITADSATIAHLTLESDIFDSEASASFTSALETGDDIDWISVDLVAGQEYIVNLEGYGPSNVPDTYLRVWAPGSVDPENGELVGRNDDGGPGLYSQLTFTAQETGRYYLDVRSFAGRDSGDYQLSISEHLAEEEPQSFDDTASQNYLAAEFQPVPNQDNFDLLSHLDDGNTRSTANDQLDPFSTAANQINYDDPQVIFGDVMAAPTPPDFDYVHCEEQADDLFVETYADLIA